MEKYNVTGMSCAACSARVEKVVSEVSGVDQVQVNLLTNSMMVEGSARKEDIIAAVEHAGYGASPMREQKQKGAAVETNQREAALEDEFKDTETKKIAKRLMWSLLLLLPLMYLSMGHTMWAWPVPGFLQDNHVAIALTELLFTVAIMIINQKFFVNGCKGLLHLAPNMDTLVALGASASFGYSLYATYAMTYEMKVGNPLGAHAYMHELYFESAAMILTLITVGKMLESYSKGRTTDALKSLMKLTPKEATRLKEDGSEEVVPVTLIEKGDMVLVKPGESMPVDGVIVEGETAVDESALTGESIPVDKKVGDQVSAATMNQMGFVKVRTLRVGEDTTLSQIIQMVSDAAATKAPIAKLADKVSGIFVPAVLAIAFVTLLIWLLLGESVGNALSRAIAVLVISCPCALGLATPVAIMVGNGVGAKRGILFKNAVALEKAGKIDTVVLDKTGTLTSGKPVVTDLLPVAGVDAKTFIDYAFSLEKRSEHPLAKAVVAYGKHAHAKEIPLTEFEVLPGNGLKAKAEEAYLYAGNASFINGFTQVSPSQEDEARRLAAEGKTPIYVAKDKELLGIIGVADVLKADAKNTVARLKEMGKKVVLLTGDREETAMAIGREAGVDQIIAEVLPGDKEAHVRRLMEKGKVAMVGDGINDAPALTAADVGIAIGAGSDVAIDAADIVLVKNQIGDVAHALFLSQKVVKNIKENLFWAFFYNVIGIPLAAGAYVHLFHWSLSPMFGAAAMSMSSFCVVMNALRLNLLHFSEIKEDALQIIKECEIQEEKEMTQTLVIEGMMCKHCQAHMTEALTAMGVTAEVSFETGLAQVTTEEAHSFEEYQEVVEKAGYVLKEVK